MSAHVCMHTCVHVHACVCVCVCMCVCVCCVYVCVYACMCVCVCVCVHIKCTCCRSQSVWKILYTFCGILYNGEGCKQAAADKNANLEINDDEATDRNEGMFSFVDTLCTTKIWLTICPLSFL